MSEKKKKNKQTLKKRKKSAKGSLLPRIFGKKKAGEDDKVKKKAKARIKPLTPIERSIAEIKQMKKIGERDPERLAQLLVSMLGQERAKEEEAKRKLDQQVLDIIHRAEERENTELQEKDRGLDTPGSSAAAPN